MENPEFNRDFATTHWSMVLSSREGDSGIRRASLSQLCEAYWYPDHWDGGYISMERCYYGTILFCRRYLHFAKHEEPTYWVAI